MSLILHAYGPFNKSDIICINFSLTLIKFSHNRCICGEHTIWILSYGLTLIFVFVAVFNICKHNISQQMDRSQSSYYQRGYFLEQFSSFCSLCDIVLWKNSVFSSNPVINHHKQHCFSIIGSITHITISISSFSMTADTMMMTRSLCRIGASMLYFSIIHVYGPLTNLECLYQLFIVYHLVLTHQKCMK